MGTPRSVARSAQLAEWLRRRLAARGLRATTIAELADVTRASQTEWLVENETRGMTLDAMLDDDAGEADAADGGGSPRGRRGSGAAALTDAMMSAHVVVTVLSKKALAPFAQLRATSELSPLLLAARAALELKAAHSTGRPEC
jgi:hypothetical protein